MSKIFRTFAPKTLDTKIQAMNKVRITAIRQTVYHDLMSQYENPIEHACDIRQGQQWISVNAEIMCKR